MTDISLETLIDKAFEDRARITPDTRGEVRDGVDKALDLLDRGKARVAEKLPGAVGPEFVEGQPVAEEGGAAFLPPQRQCADRTVARARRTWWDKIPSKLEGWSKKKLQGSGLPRRSRRDHPAFGLHRAATWC